MANKSSAISVGDWETNSSSGYASSKTRKKLLIVFLVLWLNVLNKNQIYNRVWSTNQLKVGVCLHLEWLKGF